MIAAGRSRAHVTGNGGREKSLLTGDILRLSAARHSDKTAVICEMRRIDYRALDADANRFANALIASGLGKGEAMAVMSRNVPEYMIAQTGVPLFLGGTSLLIVVNVTVDTISQIQSHLLAHQYGDLIKKAKLKGRLR